MTFRREAPRIKHKNRCRRKKTKAALFYGRRLSGVPERIRTADLPLRRRSLYPAELRKQKASLHRFGGEPTVIVPHPGAVCNPQKRKKAAGAQNGEKYKIAKGQTEGQKYKTAGKRSAMRPRYQNHSGHIVETTAPHHPKGDGAYIFEPVKGIGAQRRTGMFRIYIVIGWPAAVSNASPKLRRRIG